MSKRILLCISSTDGKYPRLPHNVYLEILLMWDWESPILLIIRFTGYGHYGAHINLLNPTGICTERNLYDHTGDISTGKESGMVLQDPVLRKSGNGVHSRNGRNSMGLWLICVKSS
jgi:hypothetical protein